MVWLDRSQANLLDASRASRGTKYFDAHDDDAQHDPDVLPLLLL